MNTASQATQLSAGYPSPFRVQRTLHFQGDERIAHVWLGNAPGEGAREFSRGAPRGVLSADRGRDLGQPESQCFLTTDRQILPQRSLSPSTSLWNLTASFK